MTRRLPWLTTATVSESHPVAYSRPVAGFERQCVRPPAHRTDRSGHIKLLAAQHQHLLLGHVQRVDGVGACVHRRPEGSGAASRWLVSLLVLPLNTYT